MVKTMVSGVDFPLNQSIESSIFPRLRRGGRGMPPGGAGLGGLWQPPFRRCLRSSVERRPEIRGKSMGIPWEFHG